jgi:hypothetical protein
MNNIRITDPENYLKEMSKVNTGKIASVSAEYFELLFEDIQPLEGYKKPNKDFPNCEYHKGVLNNAQEYLDKFPNCCERHKKLNSETWFDKNNYNYVPSKVSKQISYTIHCIETCIEKEDWFKLITDYIEWNYISFGQLPYTYHTSVGLPPYINILKNKLSEEGFIPNDKALRLLDFIEHHGELDEKKSSTDLNVLVSTYEKWLKIFPFQLSHFKDLKPKFDKQLPILKGKAQTNAYTGVSYVQMHSKKSLIAILNNLTKTLLDSIDIPNLRKQGGLSDLQANQLEFIEAELSTKTKKITKSFSKGELKYVKALKNWLTIHKEYFKEIEPILNTISKEPIKTKLDSFKENLQEGGFYNLEKVKALTKPNQDKLIELANSNMAYGIAMFDYLEFCTFLDEQKGTKVKANKYLSKLYNEKANDDTQARHYRNSLVSNKPRYTSYLHKEKVIKDYQELK